MHKGEGAAPQSPFAAIPGETPRPSSDVGRRSRQRLGSGRCLARAPADREVFADALQFVALSVELLGKLGVGTSVRSRLELLERAIRAQAALLGGQAEQLFPRRAPLGVHLAQLAAAVSALAGESAWAMKIQVRVEPLAVEGVDRLRRFRGQKLVAHPLAHHRAVLGFDQGIVVRTARARLRKFNSQLLEQFSGLMVDEFAAIVGVKAANDKWKLFQKAFQQGNEGGFR